MNINYLFGSYTACGLKSGLTNSASSLAYISGLIVICNNNIHRNLYDEDHKIIQIVVSKERTTMSIHVFMEYLNAPFVFDLLYKIQIHLTY